MVWLRGTMIFAIMYYAPLYPSPLKFNLIIFFPYFSGLCPSRFLTVIQYIPEYICCAHGAFEQMKKVNKGRFNYILTYDSNRVLSLNHNGLWFRKIMISIGKLWHIISCNNTHLCLTPGCIFFSIGGLIKQITKRILDFYVFHNQESHGSFKQKLEM